MKEKKIEQAIINYLKSKGAVVEGIQSGKVMIKKGAYNHRMILQSAGCPDIITLYKSKFIGIEVKKDEEEVNKWLRLLGRYESGEELPKSYKREKDQIEYRKKILDNGGIHIITSDAKAVIDYLS